MLNLGSCLLRLCAPMADNAHKMDKVEPSYSGKVTAVAEDKRLAHHHMASLAQETCLVSLEEADRDKRETLATYNFPTEIFFMTHKTLDIGFRPVQEKFIKLNQFALFLQLLQAVYIFNTGVCEVAMNFVTFPLFLS